MPTDLTLHALLGLFCTLGFALLARAMPRNPPEQPSLDKSANTATILRCLACVFLLAATVLAIDRQGWSLGLVSCAGHASLGAACTYIGRIIVAALKNRMQAHHASSAFEADRRSSRSS